MIDIISAIFLIAVLVYIFAVVINIYGIEHKENDCIDSIQNVPVSDELEEAAKHYLYSNILYDDVYVGNPTDKDCIQMFKAGSQWKEQQLMAKAVDGVVMPNDDEIWCELKSFDFKEGDKVKVIVIKED